MDCVHVAVCGPGSYSISCNLCKAPIPTESPHRKNARIPGHEVLCKDDCQRRPCRPHRSCRARIPQHIFGVCFRRVVQGMWMDKTRLISTSPRQELKPTILTDVWYTIYIHLLIATGKIAGPLTSSKRHRDAMEISYDRLSSHGPGWRDGLQWLEELVEWSRA